MRTSESNRGKFLISHKTKIFDDKSVTVYGIVYRKGETEIRFDDISDDPVKVNALVDELISSRCDEVHLQNVIEDYIANGCEVS